MAGFRISVALGAAEYGELLEAARANARSLNGEVVWRLRRSLAERGVGPGQAAGVRGDEGSSPSLVSGASRSASDSLTERDQGGEGLASQAGVVSSSAGSAHRGGSELTPNPAGLRVPRSASDVSPDPRVKR